MTTYTFENTFLLNQRHTYEIAVGHEGVAIAAHDERNNLLRVIDLPGPALVRAEVLTTPRYPDGTTTTEIELVRPTDDVYGLTIQKNEITDQWGAQ